MFRIQVIELSNTGDPNVERYAQTVDTIDLPDLIAVVNKKKRIRKTKDEKEK